MLCNRLIGLGLFLTLLTLPCTAAPFTSVVVYGDSLSDNGNLFELSGQPEPPYYMGRASNGPVAVELLAQSLGAGLLDFAFAGATTGIGNNLDQGTPTTVGVFNLPGMQTMYATSLPAVAPLAPTSLFVVWGGPDDFLSPSPLDPDPIAVANRAVDNLVGLVSALQGLGAQSILVPGMPDLGLTPKFLAQGPLAAAQATLLSDYFNVRLSSLLPGGAVFYDTSALLRTIVGNPGAYGFTNVTDACLAGQTVCADPASYLFWDDSHPTARGHEILANEFAAAIPEPSTIVLTFGGLLAAAVVRRRFSARL